MNISASTFSLHCGKHNDFIVGRIWLSSSLDISMTNSDSLFDFMVSGLLPTTWVKLFSIIYVLNFPFFPESTLHLKSVAYELGFHLGDSSSSARIWRAFRLLTLPSAYIFLITLFFSFHSHYSLPCAHLDSFEHLLVLSLLWSSLPQFRQTPFRLHLTFVFPYL